MEIDDPLKLLQKAEQLIEEQKSKPVLEFPSENKLTGLSGSFLKLLESKPNIKGQYLIEEAKLKFGQYLTQNSETWPSQEETEAQCKETEEKCRHVKDKIEEEKTQLEALLEIADDGHSLLQKNIEDLENEILETKEKITRAEIVKKQYDEKLLAVCKTFSCSESVEQMKLSKKEQIDKLDTEIQKGKLGLEALSKQIHNYRNLMCQLRREREDKYKLDQSNKVENGLAKKEIANLRELLEEMEKLGGIEECPADYNQIKIKFVNPSQTESQLYITFTLCHDSVGDVKLKNVEVNVSSLHCSDLIENALRTNDVRSFITQLRDRWNTYYPIMTEIEQVSECHAVDWIQDQGLVRVLVGKGGTVMFTLKMPPDYLITGDITVVNASGLPSNMSVADSMPPLGFKRLQEWVDYLEDKFGKP